VSAAPPVAVMRWRDLPGARKGMPAGLLAVLVAGQHAGAIAREGDGWVACHQARTLAPARETEHATAEEAVRAVLRSGFARYLGARAASRVYWSTAATRVAGQGGAR
jgi:hypothetical protein